jgi:hypothetical protein
MCVPTRGRDSWSSRWQLCFDSCHFLCGIYLPREVQTLIPYWLHRLPVLSFVVLLIFESMSEEIDWSQWWWYCWWKATSRWSYGWQWWWQYLWWISIPPVSCSSNNHPFLFSFFLSFFLSFFSKRITLYQQYSAEEA